MSPDPETTRIVRSWLDEGVTQLPDRVLDAVLDQVPATPQRRATWWPARGLQPMDTMLKIAVAAAVVVVTVLIGVNTLGTSNVGGPGILPDSSATPERSPTPALTPPADGSLPEGAQHLLSEAGKSITVTIPGPGWYGEPGGGTLVKNENAGPPDGAGMIIFGGGGDLFVYEDPCKWSTTRPDKPVTTVEELVVALAAQPSREASAPIHVTVSRYGGKMITLRVPDDAAYERGRFTECDQGEFRTLVTGADSARHHQSPGQIDDLWILDVEGELVVIDVAYYDRTPDEHVSEMDDIVDFMTFE